MGSLCLNVFAKGSSPVENNVSFVGTCMVQVSDANATRFFNVNYIRTIEIVRKNTYDTVDTSVVTIRMASNYSA
ncbi:hypothetical protein GW796_08055 [archaeon]|nr:hypothetical protein [archaeon]